VKASDIERFIWVDRCGQRSIFITRAPLTVSSRLCCINSKRRKHRSLVGADLLVCPCGFKSTTVGFACPAGQTRRSAPTSDRCFYGVLLFMQQCLSSTGQALWRLPSVMLKQMREKKQTQALMGTDRFFFRLLFAFSHRV